MAISSKDQEQLESFTKGTLTETEAKELEHKLNNDPEFLAEAQDYIHFLHLFKQADPDRILAKRMLSAVNAVPSISRMRLLRPIILLVATISLLIIALFWMMRPEQNSPPQFVIEEDFGINISSVSVSADSMPLAETAYNNGTYLKAATLFKEAYQIQPNNKRLLYNYGVSCFKLKQYPEAIVAFETVAKSNHNLNQAADFYLAYTYFKNQQVDESKKILNSIINRQDHIKHDDARVLLNQIEKK